MNHPVVAIEITYPFAMGGEMLEGYMCNDQQMAQLVVDAAIESAKYLERERIIKLLEADTIAWSPTCSLPLDIEHCQFCAERVLLIEAIKGENK